MSAEDEYQDEDRAFPTPRISVRSLLLSDEDADPALKLPAISSEFDQHVENHLPSLHESHLDVYRSSPVPSANLASASSSSSTPSSSRSSLSLGSTSLPGIASLTSVSSSRDDDDIHPPAKRHTEDDIVRGVKRLELADQQAHQLSALPAQCDRESSRRSGSTSRRGSIVSTSTNLSSTAAMSSREMRKRHTALIKAWIVAVNVGFQRRQVEEAARLEAERIDAERLAVVKEEMIDEDEDENEVERAEELDYGFEKEDYEGEDDSDEARTPIAPRREIMV
jgi:hypothetical protein